MPGLVQQKRNETTWGGGSVRVALGERDRLVGLMKVSTRNNAHWERPFASTISAWRSNSKLEDRGGRDVIHKLECII